jgi:prolyl 4-hydroxylase
MLAHLLDLTRPFHFTVDAVLTPEECRAMIACIDAAGPQVAPIARPSGAVVDLGTRNNERVMFEDVAFAALLFQRVRAALPEQMMGMQLASANERLRCYRYRPGQRFRPHYDGAFVRSDDERSLLTLMVYLNEDFEGGETALLDFGVVVKPRTGMALLFQHHLLHEGCEVTRWVKYAVRSDVMYRRALSSREG